jgi:hypothetical protein
MTSPQQCITITWLVFSLWSVRTLYMSCYMCEVYPKARVEAGSNTFTVTLRVVGGDEKGSLKSETLKYGRWQGPAAYAKDRPALSLERAPHKNKTVTVKWFWGSTPRLLFIASGVGLSALYCGHFWPIVPTPDDRWGGMKICRGNRSTRRKPAPAPLCPPQIPLDQPGIEPGPPRWHQDLLTDWPSAAMWLWFEIYPWRKARRIHKRQTHLLVREDVT